jgi:uncharacterized repeat protein (TIGR03803 family)
VRFVLVVEPSAGVVLDAAGNLYGETELGGANDRGTVFELNKNSTLTLLHSFAGSDGEAPIGGLIRDKARNLYGTTYMGGSHDAGTVWKLTP